MRRQTEIKISILVPVYNVEQWLQRCVDSVLAQDYQDWELVLVVDGSTDDSPALCDAYAARDSRIIAVHKRNGGLPSARKAGFEASHGCYIVFLDSDDWLLPGALTTLHTAISSTGADIVRTRPLRVTASGDRWVEHYAFEQGTLHSGAEFAEHLLRNTVAPYLHSGIYRREMIDVEITSDIITHGITIGEDWIENYAMTLRARRVEYVATETMVYYLNIASMINSNVRSWEYGDRIASVTCKINRRLPSELQQLSTDLTKINNVRKFFLPELPFAPERYVDIRHGFAEALDRVGRATLPLRYRLFIGCPLLFRLYTRLFRFVYSVVRLHGRRRHVI